VAKRNKIILWALLSIFALPGNLCAQQTIQNSNIPFWKKMNKYSLGRLGPKLPEYCSNQGPIGGLPETITHGIFGILVAPIQGALVYDDTLVLEDLQDQFSIISDVQMPPVIVAERTKSDIAFFYSMGIVTFKEVSNAASKFCRRYQRAATYFGSSRMCVTSKGARDPFTYVISDFSCR